MSIAILIKNTNEMDTFEKMIENDMIREQVKNYPVLATINVIGGKLECMGLHEVKEKNFLVSAGYTLLSIEH